MLDETTEFGQRATRRLHEEIIGWLTTVTPDGGPRPIPVWFLWDGERSILLYSRPEKRKLANIAANPKVSLNLDSDGIDADIVICWGEMRVSDDPPANEVPEYIAQVRGPRSRRSAGRRRASPRTSPCRCASSSPASTAGRRSLCSLHGGNGRFPPCAPFPERLAPQRRQGTAAAMSAAAP